MGQFLYDARCRYCSCRNVWTSRLRFRDILGLVVFNRRPLRCHSCKRRFFVKPVVYFGHFAHTSEQAPAPSSDGD